MTAYIWSTLTATPASRKPLGADRLTGEGDGGTGVTVGLGIGVAVDVPNIPVKWFEIHSPASTARSITAARMTSDKRCELMLQRAPRRGSKLDGSYALHPKVDES